MGSVENVTWKGTRGRGSPTLLNEPGRKLKGANNTIGGVSCKTQALVLISLYFSVLHISACCVSRTHSLSWPQHSEALSRGGRVREQHSYGLQIFQQAVLPNKCPCFVVHGWNLATWQLSHSNSRAI